MTERTPVSEIEGRLRDLLHRVRPLIIGPEKLPLYQQPKIVALIAEVDAALLAPSATPTINGPSTGESPSSVPAAREMAPKLTWPDCPQSRCQQFKTCCFPTACQVSQFDKSSGAFMGTVKDLRALSCVLVGSDDRELLQHAADVIEVLAKSTPSTEQALSGETPRTQRLLDEIKRTHPEEYGPSEREYLVDHARQLERELADMEELKNHWLLEASTAQYALESAKADLANHAADLSAAPSAKRENLE